MTHTISLVISKEFVKELDDIIRSSNIIISRSELIRDILRNFCNNKELIKEVLKDFAK